MRTRLETIIKLTSDDTYSHAARMVSIREEAKAALVELDKAMEKTGVGTQAGNVIPPKSPAPAAAPAK